MNCTDFLPRTIQDKIKGWSLGRPLLQNLVASLRQEISTREEIDFRRIVAPFRALILPLTEVDPDTGEERDFVFWIDPWVRPGERTVIECRDCSQPLSMKLTGRTLGE